MSTIIFPISNMGNWRCGKYQEMCPRSMLVDVGAAAGLWLCRSPVQQPGQTLCHPLCHCSSPPQLRVKCLTHAPTAACILLHSSFFGCNWLRSTTGSSVATRGLSCKHAGSVPDQKNPGPALGARSLNPWTTSEVSPFIALNTEL